ncbi:MAG TPA: hypothetical protein VK531_12410 [Gemmatimonadales bacterium]|nr:hypothetical protein [Gemmatimonadales bacterium]
MKTSYDLHIIDQGSVCLLQSGSPAGAEWIALHLDPDALRWAGRTVIEPRYLQDLVDGARLEGLTVVVQ